MMKNRLIGLLLVSTLYFLWSCQKETSFETGGGPSSGSLQSDISGDCLPKTVEGNYEVGQVLDGNVNYIQVQVNVVDIGAYVITTDTVNGIHFSASGVFTTPGLVTVKLKGKGTPTTDGITNFIVKYDGTVCSIAVTVLPAGGAVPAVFTFDCASAQVFGTYVVGTPLNLSNYIEIDVNVTAPGVYNITTAASNGMVFKGSGTLAVGSQTITLTGDVTTTPVSANTPGLPTNIPVDAGGGPSCGVELMVTGPATFTIDCASATPNGTYTERVALTGTNTITIPVNVTAIGSYSITATINGMTFTASGTFATATPQNVTLTGTGTPTDGGTFNLPLTANGVAACNVQIVITPVDYYPRKRDNNWSYEYGGDVNDSILTVATNYPPRVVGGNSFAIFGRSPDATLGFDTSNYFRKAAGTYYRWQNMRRYLGFDVSQFAEFIFIKDDQAVGHKWTTAVYSGTITDPGSGTVFNVSARISYEILQKDVSVTVKGTPYPNTIRIKESYEININGTGWQDGTPIYGSYEDYYSRNIGWVMSRGFDETGAEVTGALMELRRYQVAF